jgi:predicted TIM-barrel fold metal-dependent hydrolase
MIIDCHNHVGVDLLFYLRGEFPYAQHLSAMIREGRALGVDRWIVFPFVSNLALNIAKMREAKIDFPGEFETVPYAFENRRLLQEIYELFPELGKFTLPFVMLDPMRNTEAQAKELRKLRGQYKFYGLKIQSTILQADIKSLAQQGRCFLELAEEWGIPFLIHSSVNPADKWAQAKDILKIAEENSCVRFCLAHSCRFDKECLDRVNELPNTWFDNSAHCIHCDCAVQNLPVVAPENRRFKSDFSNPARVIADLAAAYPRKFMWGSDSPFYSYVGRLDGGVLSLMSSYEKEVAALKAQSKETLERIAHKNILDFLRLKNETVLTGK